jgi:ATP-dependent Clp protease adaptor protein ClpS
VKKNALPSFPIQFKCQYHKESKQFRTPIGQDVMSNDKRFDNEDNGGVILDKKIETQKPALYRVLMLNDDYTPMEFVVMVLQRFFGHNTEAAQRIMLHVHQRGVGVCGIFTYEVAEAKADQVMTFARKNEHPLQLQLEKE